MNKKLSSITVFLNVFRDVFEKLKGQTWSTPRQYEPRIFLLVCMFVYMWQFGMLLSITLHVAGSMRLNRCLLSFCLLGTWSGQEEVVSTVFVTGKPSTSCFPECIRGTTRFSFTNSWFHHFANDTVNLGGIQKIQHSQSTPDDSVVCARAKATSPTFPSSLTHCRRFHVGLRFWGLVTSLTKSKMVTERESSPRNPEP